MSHSDSISNPKDSQALEEQFARGEQPPPGKPPKALPSMWAKLKSYLAFWRKQESPTEDKATFNLRAMHTINKISITVFVLAIIFLALKWTVL